MKPIIFLLLASLSTNAFAWGEKEQGVVIGIAGTLMIEELLKIRKQQSSGEYPPFKCDANELECAYRLGVYERERMEHEERKRKAYECGRYGTNCE